MPGRAIRNYLAVKVNGHMDRTVGGALENVDEAVEACRADGLGISGRDGRGAAVNLDGASVWADDEAASADSLTGDCSAWADLRQPSS